MGVKQPVPAIRDESMAVWRLARAAPRPGSRAAAVASSTARRVAVAPNGTISTGSGKRPSIGTHFDSSAITSILRRRRGHDLLAQQRAAAALDQGQIGRDLVGAVDGQIELGRLVERGQRDAEPLGLGAGRLRGGDGDHVEAAAHALGQQLDKVLRGRAGAEPKPHARPHEFDGAGGGGTLLSVDVHEVVGLPAPAKVPIRRAGI